MNKKTSSVLAGLTVAGFLATVSPVSAAVMPAHQTNGFGITEVSGHDPLSSLENSCMRNSQDDTKKKKDKKEGSCGEGSCGEGTCGTEGK